MKKILLLCLVAFSMCTMAVAQQAFKIEQTFSVTKVIELKKGKDGNMYSLQDALNAFWTYKLAIKNCTTDACKLSARDALLLVTPFTDWVGEDAYNEKKAFFAEKYGDLMCGVRAVACLSAEMNCVGACDPINISCLNQCATYADNCMRGCPVSN